MQREDNIIRVVIIGFGNRGQKYAGWIFQNPDKVKAEAIVDSDDNRFCLAKDNYGIPVFHTVEEFLHSGLEADAVIIATPDKDHYQAAMLCIENKLNVLVEKPMAVTAEQCKNLAAASHKHGVVVSVCHILRFHPFYLKLKEVLDLPELGKLMSVNHVVNVGIDRSVHTFVRGLWSKSSVTSPVFLSKCSHDVDLLLWLCGQSVKKYSSFGSLGLFKIENAPQNSSDRCVDCSIERQCPFSAVDLYRRRRDWISFLPRKKDESLDAAIERELSQGEHGRCVYRCDNDAPDHQLLSMEMENGAVVSILMNFLTKEDGRTSYFSFSGGEVWAQRGEIRYRFFSNGDTHVIDCTGMMDKPLHSGADYAVLENFIDTINGTAKLKGNSADDSLESHLICLGAVEQINNNK